MARYPGATVPSRCEMVQSPAGKLPPMGKMGAFGANRALRGIFGAENGRNRRETFVQFHKVRRSLDLYGETAPVRGPVL